MYNNWHIRLLAGIALLAGAFYFLAPTLVYSNLTDEQLAEVRKDSNNFSKYLASWMPESHIVPGLDLQGGVHMVLSVELDKAVRDRAKRTASRLRADLEDKKIGATVEYMDSGSGESVKVTFNDAAGLAQYEKDVADNYTDLVEVSKNDTELVVRLNPDSTKRLRSDAVDQTIKTITNRIDKMHVTEPSITKRGDSQIQIQLPGYSNPEEAKSLLGRTAQLEFLMCDDESEVLVSLTDLPEGVTPQSESYRRDNGSAGRDMYLIFAEDKKDIVRAYLNGKVPPGRTVKFGRMRGDDDNAVMRTYLLVDEVNLTGDDLVDARIYSSQSDMMNPESGVGVSMEFSPSGGAIFADLTTKNVGKRMAIVLEDTVDSAPYIKGPITGGSASITMGRGTYDQRIKDAQDLALVLKSGALPAPVSFREQRVVGATLGKDAVEGARMAFLVGTALVGIFMLIYYRIGGLFAMIGIVLNLVFTLATLSWLGGTLTLPGIAGLLLTVGVAVDANVLVNERIRDELRRGKSVGEAISYGYDAAFSAIWDSNFTAFIAGIVLWQYGSGPVQNFATTLLIGTAVTLLTAVWYTRIFFDMYAATNPKSLSV